MCRVVSHSNEDDNENCDDNDDNCDDDDDDCVCNNDNDCDDDSLIISLHFRTNRPVLASSSVTPEKVGMTMSTIHATNKEET